MTTIIGATGFGKSVLVQQAIAENRLSSQGHDVLVRCAPGPQASVDLVSCIVAACRVDDPQLSEDQRTADRTAQRLTAALGERWPLGVCVAIDDVHHLVDDPRGAGLIAGLVAHAPMNVHFVLAGRSRITGLASARASAHVIDIAEDELSFTCQEIESLADLVGADALVVSLGGGWPAATMLAATHGAQAVDDYVGEVVVSRLSDCERDVLSIAARIGGGDPALLQCAIADDEVGSIDPVELLGRLPMVRRTTDGSYMVHEFWRRFMTASFDSEVVHRAVARTVEELIDRDEFDRAFRLAASCADWAAAKDVLTACCRRGHADVAADVSARWLDLLPIEQWEEPGGLLLRGLVGRVSDPFGESTAEVLERAVDAYRSIGNVAGEIAAGVELVYVLRNQGRCDALPVFLARAVELDDAGHPEVAGPAAVAHALLAELSGDDRAMLARLDAVPAGSLSRDWRTVVAFRQTIGHLSLGDGRAMVNAAARCADLARGSNDRHVLALAKWFDGEPEPLLSSCSEIVADAKRSTVDSVFLNTMAATALLSVGRIEQGADCLAAARHGASGSVSVLMRGALVGVEALLAVTNGDDVAAARILASALDECPLTDPIGRRMAARWLPLAYVLVPSCRDLLDRGSAVGDVGPLHQRRLDVARAVVKMRGGATVTASDIDGLDAGTIITSIPLRWATALAAILATDDPAAGRRRLEQLMAFGASPVRECLRACAESADRATSAGARKLLAAAAVDPERTVQLSVLGPVTLRVGDAEEHVDQHWNRERVRSLLLYLVLNPAARREQITDALWPDLDIAAADRNLRVTLTYLNRVLEPDRRNGEAPYFIRQNGPTLTLDPTDRLRIDLVEFDELLDQADDADARGVPSAALGLLDRALDMWRGPGLTDVAYEDWAAPTCRRVTARYVAASLRASELHCAAGRTEKAVLHARRALAADEWSESAHQGLVAAALAAGDRCRAARLLADCDAMLADLGVAASESLDALRSEVHAAQRQRQQQRRPTVWRTADEFADAPVRQHDRVALAH